MNETRVSTRKGRKRKANAEVVDPLKEKIEQLQRIKKAKSTKELVESCNLNVALPKSLTSKPNDGSVGEVNITSLSTDQTSVKSKRNETKTIITDNARLCDESTNSLNSLNIVELNLSEQSAKDNLMHRFLSSVNAASTFADGNRTEEKVNEHNSNELIIDSYNACETAVEQTSLVYDVNKEISDILSKLPPLKVDELLPDIEDKFNNVLTSFCDNEKGDSIDEDIEDSDALLPIKSEEDSEQQADALVSEVSEEQLCQIANEKWHCVNGTYNSKGEWREWHQTTDALNDYTGHVLHILPYVHIDYSTDTIVDSESENVIENQNETDLVNVNIKPEEEPTE